MPPLKCSFHSWKRVLDGKSVCPTHCLEVKGNLVKNNVDKYIHAFVLLLCSGTPLNGEDVLLHIICQHFVVVIITTETIYHRQHHLLFQWSSHFQLHFSVSGEHHSVRRRLLYRSPSPKSVDQIQHPRTRVWPISARRGWSRDGGPGGQQPMSVRAGRTKGSRQRSLVAWMGHYSCPRRAHLRRHDGATVGFIIKAEDRHFLRMICACGERSGWR